VVGVSSERGHRRVYTGWNTGDYWGELRIRCGLRIQAQRLLGAEMVKRLHDVVGDEGRGAPALGELVIARDAQREIKLEPRAFDNCSASFDPPSAPSAISVSDPPLGAAVKPR
jgi:hypothetical protein